MVVNATIKRKLRDPSASPFIAHVELSEKEEVQVAEGLKSFVKGQAGLIRLALERFPAAASWYLAVSLARNYRTGDARGGITSAIYPHIERAFQSGPILQQHKLSMAVEFRKAANSLGLVLPQAQTNFYADYYVCQAGIAAAQLSSLAKAFLKAELVFGPPPDEDTQRLNMWEVRATQAFAQGLSRLQNIMAWDETAYHAGLFARVRRGDRGSFLARQLAEEIDSIETSGGLKGFSLEERSRLALLDGVPSIIAPAQQGVVATHAGRQRTIAPGRAWELPVPWSSHVQVEEQDGDATATSTITFLPKPESIAVFDADSGAFLGIPEPGSELTVDAREVAIASRSPIKSCELRGHQLGPEGHILFLRSEKNVQVTVGGSEFFLKPPMRPRVLLDAERLLAGPGGGLFCHPNSLEVSFPAEPPEDAILVIEHPALAEPRQVQLGKSGAIDLQDILPRTGPAGPLSVAVIVGEGGRSLIRSSQWVWPGLLGLDGFAFDAPVPSNFDPAKSEFVIKGSDRLALEASASWRSARISFRHCGRTVAFNIPRPGLSVSVVDEYGRERPHAPGDKITISRNSSDVLVVRTDDNSAKLVIRGVKEEDSFGTSFTRRLALSGLDQKTGDNQILYLPGGDTSRGIVVAELALSTEPTSFSIERHARDQSTRIEVGFSVPIDAVRLKMKDLGGEELEEWIIPLGIRPAEGAQTPHFCGSAKSCPDNSPGCRVELILDAQLVEGTRLAELEFRTAGEERFRALRNLRGDAFLFLLGDTPALTTKKEFIFASEVLARCVAQETWHKVKPLLGAWREKGGELAQDGQYSPLLQSWGLPPTPGQSSSWVPLRHPVEIHPELLSVPPGYFHAIGDEGDGTSELANLHAVAALERVREASTTLQVDPSFFLGFANWMDAERQGVRLRGFSITSLNTMRGAMKSEPKIASSWRPSDGRLTSQHHDWCVENFIDRFEMAEPNAARRVRLNRMVNMLSRDQRGQAIQVPERLVNRCQIAPSIAAFLSCASRAWRNGDFPAFLSDLSNGLGDRKEAVLEDVGFLLRLAPEITAFYLLLWELVHLSERNSQ